MTNLTSIKSLRAQDYGVAGLSTTDVDWMIAEVERLTAALAVQTELLADANAQLNVMRIDRGRYKAWHDAVMAQEPVAVCTVKDGDLMMMIVRPKPLEKV